MLGNLSRYRCSTLPTWRGLLVGLLLTQPAHLLASDSDIPKPVPPHRPEMKAALEALKQRTPRLPLPQDEEQRGVNNGRMRNRYLPDSWLTKNRNRPQPTTEQVDTADTPMSYAFTVCCFWITSRANNCHYCLGHQELKLRGAGISEDRIASLDCDWSNFSPALQAALAYTRKLTLDPHLMNDDDIASLRPYLKDSEIVDLTFQIARFNATNRWTDGLGIPQDQSFHEIDSILLTPTNAQFEKRMSCATPDTRQPRPEWQHAEMIWDQIKRAQHRVPRIAISSDADAANGPPHTATGSVSWRWEHVVSSVLPAGAEWMTIWNTIGSDEHLPLKLKAEIAWITAVNNHAWYAAGHAARRLLECGVTQDEMWHLVERDRSEGPSQAQVYQLARKLTVDPHLITDKDIALVRQQFNDQDTARIVHVICMANLFDRFTEALCLPLEASVGAPLGLTAQQ